MPSFEWGPAKAKANGEKHGLSFEEASELFLGAEVLEIYDAEHSDDEERFVAIGSTSAGIVVVVYTQRQEDVIRIVSARKATKREVQLFHDYEGGKSDG